MIDGESGEKTFETLVKSQDEVRQKHRQLHLQKQTKTSKYCEMVKRCLLFLMLAYVAFFPPKIFCFTVLECHGVI